MIQVLFITLLLAVAQLEAAGTLFEKLNAPSLKKGSAVLDAVECQTGETPAPGEGGPSILPADVIPIPHSLRYPPRSPSEGILLHHLRRLQHRTWFHWTRSLHLRSSAGWARRLGDFRLGEFGFVHRLSDSRRAGLSLVAFEVESPSGDLTPGARHSVTALELTGHHLLFSQAGMSLELVAGAGFARVSGQLAPPQFLGHVALKRSRRQNRLSSLPRAARQLPGLVLPSRGSGCRSLRRAPLPPPRQILAEVGNFPGIPTRRPVCKRWPHGPLWWAAQFA